MTADVQVMPATWSVAVWPMAPLGAEPGPPFAGDALAGVVLDASGACVGLAEKRESFFDLSPDDVFGRPYWELAAQIGQPGVAAHWTTLFGHATRGNVVDVRHLTPTDQWSTRIRPRAAMPATTADWLLELNVRRQANDIDGRGPVPMPIPTNDPLWPERWARAIVDADGHVIAINLNFSELLGRDPLDVVAVEMSELFHPEDIAEIQRLRQTLATTPTQSVLLGVRLHEGQFWRRVLVQLELPPLAGALALSVLPAEEVLQVGLEADELAALRNHVALLERAILKVAAEVNPAAELARDRLRPPTVERLAGLTGLSTREFEIVQALAAGKRAPTIARELFVSQSTVRNHLSSVYRKLGVSSQEELVRMLREPS